MGTLQKSETAEQTNQQDKLLVKIGVIGAPSVGKSTLTAALARLGQDQLYEPSSVAGAVATTDSLATTSLESPFPEQQSTKADATYATKHFFCHHYDLPALEHGNEDQLHHALAQLTGAILVLDFQAGITTATRNLLRLIQKAGIPLVVPFLNKCDTAPWMVTLDDVEETVETELVAAGFPAVTPIWGAALPALVDPASTWGEMLEQFLLHLDYHLKAWDEAQFCNQ